MKKNVGSTDKILRIVIGVLIIVIGLISKSWWGLIGLIPLATALLSWCPVYTLLGITTCKVSSEEQK